MKRLLALLLCLTCLLGILASCHNEPTTPPVETPTPSEPSTPSDEGNGEGEGNGGGEGAGTVVTAHALSEYTVVYPKDASDSVKHAAGALAMKINLCVGDAQIAVIADDQTATTKHEILIGETSRAASAAYYAGEAKAEYAVRNVEDSFVLAGFSDALTKEAVQYFITAYVEKAANGSIAAVTDYTGTPEHAIVLTSKSGNDAKVVYDASENYLGDISLAVVNHLKSAIGTSLRRSAAETAFDASSCEIMVGNFDFAELQSVKDALWMDGYVIAVVGKKVVISASTEADYEKAAVAFGDMVAENTLKGTKQVVFLAGDAEREFSTELLANLPYVSGKPTAVYPGGMGAYVAVYEDVNRSIFDAYVMALEYDGFTQYSMTNFDGARDIHKNCFATYITDGNSVDIGFHAKGYVGFGNEYAGGILYVTVTPREDITLYNVTTPAYTPVDQEQYPLTLTQLGFGRYHPDSRSNCYIIRLADGSFIIHDSAFGSYESRTVGDEIYEVLKKQAPDPNNIVITAWFHTHPHNDHVTGFVQFAKTYATGYGVTIKQFVHNFPDETIWGPDQLYQERVAAAMKKFPGAEYVRPHTGNVLHYPGVKFNVIYTQEDYLALCQGSTYFYHNASSLVMQMVTDDGTTVILPGDSPMTEQLYAADGDGPAVRTYGTIHKRYGSFIESDVLCYFHHGRNSGGTLAANQVIKPKIVLLPTTWGSLADHNTATLEHARYFMDGLDEGVLYDTPNANGVYGWFVAQDGAQVLTLKDGKITVVDYDSLAAYYAS